MGPRLTVLVGSLWRRKGRLYRVLLPVAKNKTTSKSKNGGRFMVVFADVRGGLIYCREVDEFRRKYTQE